MSDVPKQILVTGGAGFMGSHLVDALCARGYAVRVFDRQPSRFLPAGAEMVVGDLGDADAVAKVVRGVDAVYHLAGFADLNAARHQPIATARDNLLGTLGLLEAMHTAGVTRFMFASTVYVFSREGGFYRCSKQACETYIEEYARVFGLRYTILRYGSLYGPRADPSNGVYRLLEAAMRSGLIQYTGAADDIREYIHVEDAARLSCDVLDDAWVGEHVLLTGPAPTRAGELFMMFQEILGQKVDIRYVAAAPTGSSSSGHYAATPYAYTPRPGKKLVSTHYVDMGQGLLRLIEELAGRIQAADSDGEAP